MWIIVGGIIVLLLVVVLIIVIALQRRRGSSVPTSQGIPGSWGNGANGATPQPLNGSPPLVIPSILPDQQVPPGQGMYRSQPPGTLSAFGAPSPSAWPNQAPGQFTPPAPSQAFSGDQTWITPGSASQPNLPGNPSVPANPNIANNSSGLVVWPCGHMNRAIARFCSVCGEPAPLRPANRQYEQ